MKDDEIILRIETFDAANGGGVGWYEDKGAYHLYLLETDSIRPSTTSLKTASSGLGPDQKRTKSSLAIIVSR